MDLPAVLEQVRGQGWATASGTAADVESEIVFSRISLQSLSTGRTTLRPVEPEKAPPRSLSAVFGMGEQPLHTDGAHLMEPADIIVLCSERPNLTPTVVYPMRQPGRHVLVDALRRGVFTVRGRDGGFLASAMSDRGVRFDPVVMSPGDEFAKAAVEFFEQERAQAVVHAWDQPNQLLFIDNRRCLHARNAVPPEDTDRQIKRLAFRDGEK